MYLFFYRNCVLSYSLLFNNVPIRSRIKPSEQSVLVKSVMKWEIYLPTLPWHHLEWEGVNHTKENVGLY